MFVTIGNISHYVSENAALVLLAGGARESTCSEAAECISRYVINGDNLMHEANAYFNRLYILSAPQVTKPLPNKAAS